MCLIDAEMRVNEISVAVIYLRFQASVFIFKKPHKRRAYIKIRNKT